MRDNQDIKDQIKKLRDLANQNNPVVNEHIAEIKKGYLIEQQIESGQDITKRYNVPDSVEGEIEDDEFKQEGVDNEIQQGYRISGGVLIMHGNDRKEVELTTEDKIAFQETMEEFVSEVSDMVNFQPLNLYKNNVDWGGVIVDFDIEFYFTLGESNGVYISCEMSKLDDNFTSSIGKLQSYYEKFKSKWAKIIAGKKKTKLTNSEE
jgi:hypothetical protein